MSEQLCPVNCPEVGYLALFSLPVCMKYGKLLVPSVEECPHCGHEKQVGRLRVRACIAADEPPSVDDSDHVCSTCGDPDCNRPEGHPVEGEGG